ncbi:MAG TPA: aminopeptidase N [Mycobacteriales bacterium]|nr:aminopeptidase N [Mycobacteriales bacterium]
MAAENLTRDEASARAALLDVASYDVELDLRSAPTDSATFRSTSTVTFGCREPGGTTHIDITADRIVEATLNGEPIDLAGFTGRRLPLPPLAASNVLRVVADCVFSRTGEGLHRFRDPVDDATYLYSQFETFDAHRMYACFDQPDLKATFAFTVDAPADWRVLSTMPVTQDGERYTFEPTSMQSTYITSLVAGPYAGVEDTHDGIPLGVYCRASLLPHLEADDILTITKQGFDAYHGLFGVRYPWPKYDQVFVPEFNMGAMENAGCVTFTESLIFRSRTTRASYERRATVILHEMAHMWFGDLVTMSWWDDLWLNESFAEYVSTQVQAEATRFSDVWTTFATSEKSWAYRQDQLPTTHPIAADIPDIEAVSTNFDGITYAKGASVLKQLVHWVGRDAFFGATRDYFDRHAYANTTLQHFLDALSAASGRDMSAWSKEWLESAGVNTLRPRIEIDDAGSFRSFVIKQEAIADQPTLRSHRLRIGLYDREGDELVRRQQVELDIAGEATEVPSLVGVQQPDLVLLNDDDLTYAKIRLDDRSWRTLVTSIGLLRDPLARALCWSAAWDMTRDAEVATGEYVDLVLVGIAGETEVSTVQDLLMRVRVAVDQYGDPAQASARRERISARAFELLDHAEPGSDLQLAFGRSAAANATTPAQLDRVAALLSGEETIEGLTVDTELRWSLLYRLVIAGRADEAEIAAEQARDDTAEGRRHARRLRCARPTAEAKAAAWHDLVETDALPNTDLRVSIDGFVQFEQAELLAAYVDRYFAAVGELYRSRTAEMAQELIEGLYPITAISQAVVDRTDAYLRDEQPGPALRRMLVEGRDGMARALRARERDRVGR